MIEAKFATTMNSAKNKRSKQYEHLQI